MWRFRESAHIAKLAGFDINRMVIVMFHYPHGSLNGLITGKCSLVQDLPWTYDVVKSLSIDIFAAINILHSAGVVHNDIKASNYLIDTSSGQLRVCLTDFGICTVLGSSMAVAGLDWNALQG